MYQGTLFIMNTSTQEVPLLTLLGLSLCLSNFIIDLIVSAFYNVIIIIIPNLFLLLTYFNSLCVLTSIISIALNVYCILVYIETSVMCDYCIILLL